MTVGSNLVPTNLASLVQHVSPESRITILGDADHSNAEQAMALISPDVIRAAARTGKTAFILEAFSDPMFQEAYDAYRTGQVSLERVREWMGGVSNNFISATDEPRMQEAYVQMFIALKENNMQLLSVNRDGQGPLAIETAHPEYMQFMEQTSSIVRDGGMEALRRYEQGVIAERGMSFIQGFNTWMAQRREESNRRDEQTIGAALQANGNPRALIVWGNEHNQNVEGDLNEILGERDTRVISVYPNQQFGQLISPGGGYRSEVPNYIFYNREGLAGMPDPQVNLSNVANGHINYQIPEQLASINQDSLAGTPRWRINIAPFEPENLGGLGRVAAVQPQEPAVPGVVLPR